MELSNSNAEAPLEKNDHETEKRLLKLKEYFEILDALLRCNPRDVSFTKQERAEFYRDGESGKTQSLEHVTYACRVIGKGTFALREEDYPPKEAVETNAENKQKNQRELDNAESIRQQQWFIDHALEQTKARINELETRLTNQQKSPTEINALLDAHKSSYQHLKELWEDRKHETAPAIIEQRTTSLLEEEKILENEIEEKAKKFPYLPSNNREGTWRDYFGLPEIKKILYRDPSRVREVPELIARCRAEVKAYEEKLERREIEEREQGVKYHLDCDLDLVNYNIAETIVITPQGTSRPADTTHYTGKAKKGRYDKRGYQIWNKIEAEELAVEITKTANGLLLLTTKKDAKNKTITEAQRGFIRELEKQHNVIQGMFGFDETTGGNQKKEKGVAIETTTTLLRQKGITDPKLLEHILKNLHDEKTRSEDLETTEGIILCTREDLSFFFVQAKISSSAADRLLPPDKENKILPNTATQRGLKDLGPIFHKGSVSKNPVYLIAEQSSDVGLIQLLTTRYKGWWNLHVRVIKNPEKSKGLTG